MNIYSMRHLKSFNESEDYHYITKAQWHSYDSDDRLPFSKREVEIIEKFIKEKDLLTEVKIEWNKDFTQLILNPVFAYISWSSIEKYDDDWYIVWAFSEPDHHYKCDQLRGLLEFIDMETS